MSTEQTVILVPQQAGTIQEAVDAASGPATVVVAPGVYRESVVVAGKRQLVIQSARLSKRGVAIVGAGGGAVITVEDGDLHVSGIEIRSNGQCRGIAANRASLNLQECVVAGNRTMEAFGAGLYARDGSLRLQKSAVVGNVVEDRHSCLSGGGGLYLDNCRVEIAGSTIQGNAVHALHELRGGGICCARSSMRMWRSRVTDNALYGAACSGGGIDFRDALDVQIGGSVITGNSCHDGRGGGIAAFGNEARIHVHRNSVVRQNYPDDQRIGDGG